MWELDCEEGWAPKNWCFWTVVLEKTLQSLLDFKEVQPFHPKGDQSWDFIGRNDAKAETPVLCSPHVKSWIIGKDPDAGRDWGQKEKGMTEDEMAGWHYRFKGHEFEWTPGVGDGQGGLACGIYGVAKSRTWLSDWTVLTDCFPIYFSWSDGTTCHDLSNPWRILGLYPWFGEISLERGKATHSSILTWRSPWTV